MMFNIGIVLVVGFLLLCVFVRVEYMKKTKPQDRTRVLFVIKRQLGYNGSPVPSKGLFNSALFVVNALRTNGVEAELVEVVDGNDIDREVTRYSPTHCIIEALWVVPEKTDELRKLHPKTQFVVRIHSNVPFLATEGMAIKWLRAYNTIIACNSHRALHALKPFLKSPTQRRSRTAFYLPNIYAPFEFPNPKKLDRTGPNIWIGSLGAIRPLKNQLQQAIAAICFAEQTKRTLVYHINTRVEQGGEPVLKNIRALFQGTKHRLQEHPWCGTHGDVLAIVKSLDLAMQLSFTETFNLVTADAVWSGVPIVVSPEIEWAPSASKADPNSIPKILEALAREEARGRSAAIRNMKALEKHNQEALKVWLDFLKGKETKV